MDQPPAHNSRRVAAPPECSPPCNTPVGGASVGFFPDAAMGGDSRRFRSFSAFSTIGRVVTVLSTRRRLDANQRGRSGRRSRELALSLCRSVRSLNLFRLATYRVGGRGPPAMSPLQAAQGSPSPPVTTVLTRKGPHTRKTLPLALPPARASVGRPRHHHHLRQAPISLHPPTVPNRLRRCPAAGSASPTRRASARPTPSLTSS